MNRVVALLAVAIGLFLACAAPARAENAWSEALASARSKIVKLHGAGGARQLEAYQTGILVSGEGHILTVASHVLSGSEVTATFDDGTKVQARVVAQDLGRDLALLAVEGGTPAGFDLTQPPPACAVGQPVLALTNLFDIASGNEPISAQSGFVAGIAPLAARQGAFATTIAGDVLYLDCVTNNPGAAGGALVDEQGRLLGLIGKELTAEATDMFVSYAIPVSQLTSAYESLRSGQSAEAAPDAAPVRQSHQLDALGFTLVPDVLLNTPPYVDSVSREGPAAKAGLRADDLIVETSGRPIRTCREFRERMRAIDRIDPVKLRILRSGKLIELELVAPEAPR